MNARMIPDIDLAAVTAGDAQALEALRVGARDVGFLTVYNTGVTAADVEAVIAAYRAFFAQPYAVKAAVDMAATGANRGWGAPRSEQVDPDANPDYKEVFDCGYEIAGSDLAVYAPNLWPEIPEGFRAAVQTYYAQALDVAMQVLRAIATVMGEDAQSSTVQYFDDKFDQPMALLRGNFYPARPDWAGDRDFGIAAHTDYGCVTLLATDGVAGLEVLGRDGAWHAVAAAPGRFVINFGEMLEMWTEGRVKATLHRVRGTAQERISVPLFFNPNYDTNIAPAGAPPMSAGAHLTRRFEQTYLHLKDKP